jgi:threonine/homoserine/homoserine lactone efflux protein
MRWPPFRAAFSTLPLAVFLSFLPQFLDADRAATVLIRLFFLVLTWQFLAAAALQFLHWSDLLDCSRQLIQ